MKSSLNNFALPFRFHRKIIDKIESVELPFKIKKEIIIVDDYSTDWTRDILKNFEKYIVVYQDKNYGKWYAIRKWIDYVTWDFVIIQDADLEYDPNDYINLINKIIDDNLLVVYWSRRLNKQNHFSHLSFFLWWILLSSITNFLYNQHITDEATCYKVIQTELLKSLNLECVRFEFCPEVTAKVSRLWFKIKEIPINYYPRSINEGKKIKWIDWLEAIETLWKYRKWGPNI